MVYLVFALAVIGSVVAWARFRRRGDTSSKSIDSFHRRLEALGQTEKAGRRR